MSSLGVYFFERHRNSVFAESLPLVALNITLYLRVCFSFIFQFIFLFVPRSLSACKLREWECKATDTGRKSIIFFPLVFARTLPRVRNLKSFYFEKLSRKKANKNTKIA